MRERCEGSRLQKEDRIGEETFCKYFFTDVTEETLAEEQEALEVELEERANEPDASTEAVRRGGGEEVIDFVQPQPRAVVNAKKSLRRGAR
mmetsp:Transcript_38661/g.75960  ORF Transcript_38661/g.75960 Transcript_38661/m.75960 type:complete len:91 (+) Transcript_38661:1264-1536(+)